MDKNDALKIAREHTDAIDGLYRIAVALGLLGFLLLASLGVTRFYLGYWPPSISHSYHTPMGDILVGTLCAIGIFLFSYKDFNPEEYLSGSAAAFWTGYWDRWWSRAAGIGAIGVALFPVDPIRITACEAIVTDAPSLPCSTGGMVWHGYILLSLEPSEFSNLFHFGSAGVFFLSILVLCVSFFPRDAINMQYLGGDLQKGWRVAFSLPTLRTVMFWGIGAVIAASLAGLVYITVYGGTQARLIHFLERNNGFFWLECSAIFAFSAAWLVKAGDFKIVSELSKGR